MDVSILIVNYNTPLLILDCLRSIKEQVKIEEYEVLIIDNASTDNSRDVLSRIEDQHVKVIYSNQNLGFGKANNLGAKEAKGEFLFLLNPDTVLINDAVSILVQYIKQHPETGVAGGNLFGPQLSPLPSYCEQFDTIKSERKKSRISQVYMEKVQQKIVQYMNGCNRAFKHNFNYSGKTKKVAYIFGADMMMPKQLFDDLGGFDPDFFMYGEEEDLTFRITEKGFRVISVPQAKIIHLEGASTDSTGSFNQRQFRMRMNGTMLYFYKRNGIDGVRKFVEYRSKRYMNLLKVRERRHKDTEDMVQTIQLRLLKEESEQFMERYNNG